MSDILQKYELKKQDNCFYFNFKKDKIYKFSFTYLIIESTMSDKYELIKSIENTDFNFGTNLINLLSLKLSFLINFGEIKFENNKLYIPLSLDYLIGNVIIDCELSLQLNFNDTVIKTYIEIIEKPINELDKVKKLHIIQRFESIYFDGKSEKIKLKIIK